MYAIKREPDAVVLELLNQFAALEAEVERLQAKWLEAAQAHDTLFLRLVPLEQAERDRADKAEREREALRDYADALVRSLDASNSHYLKKCGEIVQYDHARLKAALAQPQQQETPE